MDPVVVAEGAATFAQIDSKMQLSTMLTFLYIAQRGICNQQDIEIGLGMTGGATSRNVAYWTAEKADRTPGVGFVERFEDPRDRRSKMLRLTPQGKRFFDKIREGKVNAKAS